MYELPYDRDLVVSIRPSDGHVIAEIESIGGDDGREGVIFASVLVTSNKTKYPLGSKVIIRNTKSDFYNRPHVGEFYIVPHSNILGIVKDKG